jgi:hypothetical protein
LKCQALRRVNRLIQSRFARTQPEILNLPSSIQRSVAPATRSAPLRLDRGHERAGRDDGSLRMGLFAIPQIPDQGLTILLTVQGREPKLGQSLRPLRKPNRLIFGERHKISLRQKPYSVWLLPERYFQLKNARLGNFWLPAQRLKCLN